MLTRKRKEKKIWNSTQISLPVENVRYQTHPISIYTHTEYHINTQTTFVCPFHCPPSLLAFRVPTVLAWQHYPTLCISLHFHMKIWRHPIKRVLPGTPCIWLLSSPLLFVPLLLHSPLSWRLSWWIWDILQGPGLSWKNEGTPWYMSSLVWKQMRC